MSAVAPVLGGVPLPSVKTDGYKETFVYLGGESEMASGAYAFDLFSTAQKRRFDLTWVAMTEAQVATILSGYAAVRTGSAVFTPPLGADATVQREGIIDVSWYPAAAGPCADVTMRLREL
jgi:hypothetical protein